MEKKYCGENKDIENFGKGKLTNPSLFIDIDGTLIRHYMDENGVGVKDQVFRPVEILQGVIDKFKEWKDLGCYIVLTTARKEEYREVTESQLKNIGLHWNQLVMGVGSGERYIINDLKPHSLYKPTAIAINVVRNSGLQNVDLKLASELQTLALFYGGVNLNIFQ